MKQNHKSSLFLASASYFMNCESIKFFANFGKYILKEQQIAKI